MDRETRLKRLRFRAWHRGTKEADFLIGGFFERHHGSWNDEEVALFEALLEADEVDVMAWALGKKTPPGWLEGRMLDALRTLDYIPIAR